MKMSSQNNSRSKLHEHAGSLHEVIELLKWAERWSANLATTRTEKDANE